MSPELPVNMQTKLVGETLSSPPCSSVQEYWINFHRKLSEIHTVLEIKERELPGARKEELAENQTARRTIGINYMPWVEPVGLMCDWECDYTCLNKAGPKKGLPVHERRLQKLCLPNQGAAQKQVAHPWKKKKRKVIY